MIRSLRIENFIIVKKTELEFGKGLQVLSGETGAGKSIIVGAIDLILGGSLKPGMLFDESKPAMLEIAFDLDDFNREFLNLLKKYEIDTSEGEVFISKEIGTNFRSKGFINGRRVSQNIISEFRNVLLDFHSQRDQQKLFDQEYQLQVLDNFGNLEDDRRNFEEKFRNLENKIKELKKLEKQEAELTDRIKLYEYQVQEIKSLQLKEDEEETLQSELNLLSNAETILNLASDMEQVFYENENSVHDVISSYLSKFQAFKDDNNLIGEAISNLHESLANLDDAVRNIQDVQNLIDLDNSRLQEVQSRLDAVNSLMSKYKKSIPEILQFQQYMENEIASFSSGKDRIFQLKKEIESDKIAILKEAEELSRKRKKTAKRFEEELIENIKKLAIPDASIEIKFQDLTAKLEDNEILTGLNYNGKDEVDYYFSANKGIKRQPLRIAASGGELSRFLLTIKKVLSNKLDSRTIIFDEIDSGIGGKTSELLAEFIHNIGKFHQVLCISHLPQIAAYADRHFAIRKISGKKTSEVEVYRLTEKQRRTEIARMLSGSESELALQHADELLKKG
ncbi:MAG: DNA repair protein RecN [Candidatus Cloacimonetes bacterium]|nr:DNA repair protein RecN [Candidatus Cloacimonadota bacterium]MCF7814989.1 DNA repair protein RecN [Candidatus Cloacimonadota bacterium]MCF7868405.1 DNA repair protein RecN [Candidatus Cloacimonadota bacterium]MCF7883878.1 DNA repair protein RecN [Candidatus Cloacimonadota bacterium]